MLDEEPIKSISRIRSVLCGDLVEAVLDARLFGRLPTTLRLEKHLASLR
jgi:hypothetical protein